MQEFKNITHTFEPVFDENSKILILGTFPSVKSRENHFYYGHPQNRFWKVMAAVMDSTQPQTIEEKKNFLLENHIAVWDVIHSCSIEGSSDSSITDVVPNDFTELFARTHLLAVAANVPQDVWDAALIYTRLVFLGTLGNLGYNMNAGILRGLGDSKASLWFLVVSCISNIVFDLVFVAGFGMDVAGAALATSIAMFISWLVSIAYIRKMFPEIQFTFLPRRFSGKMMKDILAIGLPVGLNNSLYSLGHVALQTFNNSQGAVFMAGGAVAGRITGCSNIAITGLSSAATTFSGQNYGAKKYDRIKEGHWKIPICSGLITLGCGLFFIMIHKPLIRFFSSDEMVLMYASRHVVVMLLSQWFYAIFNCIISIVNGTGRVRYTTIVNILMLWAVRIPSAYIINRYFDGTWVMLCFPISFSFGMFAMIGYYLFSPAWKEVMRLAENKPQEGPIKEN